VALLPLTFPLLLPFRLRQPFTAVALENGLDDEIEERADGDRRQQRGDVRKDGVPNGRDLRPRA